MLDLIVKEKMKPRVIQQVVKSLEGQYVSLVYSGWHSTEVFEMLAASLANILLEEYDTKQDRLDAICGIAQWTIDRISEAPERTGESEENENVDSQD